MFKFWAAYFGTTLVIYIAMVCLSQTKLEAKKLPRLK